MIHHIDRRGVGGWSSERKDGEKVGNPGSRTSDERNVRTSEKDTKRLKWKENREKGSMMKYKSGEEE